MLGPPDLGPISAFWIGNDTNIEVTNQTVTVNNWVLRKQQDGNWTCSRPAHCTGTFRTVSTIAGEDPQNWDYATWDMARITGAPGVSIADRHEDQPWAARRYKNDTGWK